MAASTTTTVAWILKTNYNKRRLADQSMRDHPRYKRLAKPGGFTGKKFGYAIKNGNGQGIAGLFSAARSGASAMVGEQLEAERRKKYGIITLDGEAIRAASDDDGAFLTLVKNETNGIIKELGDTLAFDAYRDKTGMRGRRSSASTNVITLTAQDDVRNFKRGMTIQASPNADGSSPRTGTAKIVGLSYSASTITLDNAAGITSFANNDYLFRNGDIGYGVDGLAICTPLVAPTAGDSFRGIDRSVDVERLAGSRINDTATSLEENIGLLAVQIKQYGGTVTTGWLNPIRFHQIARRGNAKVEMVEAGGTFKWGFERIMIVTAGATIELISDPDCPTDLFYLTNPESEYLKTLDELPHVVMDDGNPNLRMSDEDAIEARLRSMHNYIQEAPLDFGVGKAA